MQHSLPPAHAGRRRLSDRFWTFGVSWRHWRLSLNSDLHRCSSWSTRLMDCAWLAQYIYDGFWIEVFQGARRTRSPRMFGRTGSATRRWRCWTVQVWNDRLTMAPLATIFPARCQWERAETDDVPDLIVCYVIDEALIMCNWLPVLVLYAARPNYKSRFCMIPC